MKGGLLFICLFEASLRQMNRTADLLELVEATLLYFDERPPQIQLYNSLRLFNPKSTDLPCQCLLGACCIRGSHETLYD